VVELLPDAKRFGIELVNLQGGLGTGRNNLPLKLKAMLEEDKALRRFSQILVDGDVPDALTVIRQQILLGACPSIVQLHGFKRNRTGT
jgi:hypothetical protein